MNNIIENVLSNGIKCYIIPKKDFVEKQAMIAFKYGSAYNNPQGLAHFLEHKLFEQPDYNVFDEFNKFGASSNAFTNFTTTAYYFSCNENFEDNLKILFNFVSTPHFTNDNIEKEKGIITQEIKMYDDDPMWKVYFNMFDAMYHNHYAKYNIAGTVEEINSIDKQMLDKAYSDYYTPENAVIVCSGDFDSDSVINIAENYLKLNSNSKKCSYFENEPDTIRKNFIEQKLNIERKLFNVGFKENSFDLSIPERICTSKIILDSAGGEASDLYEELYNENLIDESFYFEYTSGIDFGCSLFSGYSDCPDKVINKIQSKIEYLKQNGIDKSDFERLKNKHIGNFKKEFNSIYSISASVVDYFTKDFTVDDYLNCIESLTVEKVNDRIKNHFDLDKCVVSIIS